MSTTLKSGLCAKLAVALEIAAAKWVVASHGGGPGRIRRRTLDQATPGARLDALVAELRELRERFGADATTRMVVAYEAGQEGFWLVRALRSLRLEAEVIDPVSLQVDRRARRAKTDRLDAEALVRSLWRWMDGDGLVLRMVHVPSEAAEDDREWQRERDRLMGERLGCQDRIVKKLRTQGVWGGLDQATRRRLREGTLCRFGGQPLGAMLQQALCIELDRIELVEGKLAQLGERLPELTPQATGRIARLVQLRGIGEVGARLLALLLFWRRFDNRRQVGACTGMVGVPYDSGVTRQDQGISKAGDPRLRGQLVELAWMWLRYQPDSAITRWFHARTQGDGKRGRRIMIVAVARRLAIALWRYLHKGDVPEGARFKPQAA